MKIQRRVFLASLAGAAATPMLRPRPLRAQQTAVPVIGLIRSGLPGVRPLPMHAFRQGLQEAGYVEGHNVVIEYRWDGDQADRLPSMTAELVKHQVKVIASFAGIPAAVAAKAATKTIPIVFLIGLDPVELGLVASLNRPGGNLTGVVTLNVELGPKRLELLHELVPKATVIALLVNPTNPNAEIQSKELQTAARILGLQVRVVHAEREGDFDRAFARLAELGAGALVIGTGAPFIGQSEHLAALAMRNAMPAIFLYRDFAAAGGLVSYGGSEADAYHLAGIYTGRILNGEKAADLPVQQATKVELIINLKTAKALGITVPLSLLGRADEVIE